MLIWACHNSDVLFQNIKFFYPWLKRERRVLLEQQMVTWENYAGCVWTKSLGSEFTLLASCIQLYPLKFSLLTWKLVYTAWIPQKAESKANQNRSCSPGNKPESQVKSQICLCLLCDRSLILSLIDWCNFVFALWVVPNTCIFQQSTPLSVATNTNGQ